MADHSDGTTGNDVLSGEYSQQGALASAICTDQQNSAATLDAYGDITKHRGQLVFVHLIQAMRNDTSHQPIVQNKRGRLR